MQKMRVMTSSMKSAVLLPLLFLFVFAKTSDHGVQDSITELGSKISSSVSEGIQMTSTSDSSGEESDIEMLDSGKKDKKKKDKRKKKDKKKKKRKDKKKKEKIEDISDIGDIFPGVGVGVAVGAGVGVATGGAKPLLESKSLGSWRIVSENVGVSAMQLQLMPNNRVVWFDTTWLGPSALELTPTGNCPINFEHNVPDCFCHALAYDAEIDTTRQLHIKADPWCSTGSLSAEGNLIGTGGYYKGTKSIRILKPCPDCDFEEKADVLGSERWYASQHILEDGNIVLLGGRRSFNYEIIPPDTLNFPIKQFDLPFLKETTDPVENNLYPFLYLTPDGNLFLFANNRAIIFDPKTAKTVRELPPLPGGSRNYPASGMSAVLPIHINPEDPEDVSFEVLVCGGNSPLAFYPADSAKKPKPDNVFWPALQDCGRIEITLDDPVWEKEMMLSPRVMGDMLILPTGDLLILNGAKKGTSGWWDAAEPNLTPELYVPSKPSGQRFKKLNPTTIPRMYHSTSAVLASGEVLVAGSNPNDKYVFEGEKFPTELRVEKFSPPYLDESLAQYRPHNRWGTEKMQYGKTVILGDFFDTKVDGLEACDFKLTLLSPPFTTHGYSQQQRLLVLDVKMQDPETITAVAPPNPRIAPPGYYISYLVYRGVPSPGMWVKLEK